MTEPDTSAGTMTVRVYLSTRFIAEALAKAMSQQQNRPVNMMEAMHAAVTAAAKRHKIDVDAAARGPQSP